MKIRDLKTRDIFPLTRILSKLDFRALRKGADDEGNIPIVEVVGMLFDRIPLMEGELMPFLADLVGKTVDELSDEPLEVLYDIVRQLAQRPEVAGFFASNRQDAP